MSLGLGSVIATTFDAAPWLIAVGRHKSGVFVGVGALLAVNYWMAIVRPRQLNCPPGAACAVDSPATRVNQTLFWVSLAVYAGAALFTYGALLWIRLSS